MMPNRPRWLVMAIALSSRETQDLKSQISNLDLKFEISETA